MTIKYIEEPHKYTLAEDAYYRTGIKGFDIDTHFIKLSSDGLMLIRKDYGWDGASGPTIDTKDTMQGSLVHDAGYDLIKAGLLPKEYKGVFDAMLYAQCVADAKYRISKKPAILRPLLEKQAERRFLTWYNAVYYAADFACDPKNAPKILEAP